MGLPRPDGSPELPWFCASAAGLTTITATDVHINVANIVRRMRAVICMTFLPSELERESPLDDFVPRARRSAFARPVPRADRADNLEVVKPRVGQFGIPDRGTA